MRIFYDLYEDEIMVDAPDGPVTLKNFYIAARKEAGISIPKLTRDTGLEHPQLYVIENPKTKSNGRHSHKLFLAALETLGYSITIE